MSMDVFAELALRYFEAGCNVLPIVRGTKRPPAGVLWRAWQRRRQMEAEVAQLVNAHPAADIALLCGRPSGGLVDIETDGPDGEAALRALRLPLPPTASSASPRGQHRLYRSPVQLRSRVLRRHLDVLADGHYVVVPPSSGRRWLTLRGLAEVAPLPDAWRELLARESTGPRTHVTGPELFSVERDGITEGLRNITLASLVGHWLTQGHTEPEIHRKALAWARKCSPVLEESETRMVVESVQLSRRRARSPERQALLLARVHGLRQPERSVFVALVALRGELGLAGPTMLAPCRLVADFAGVSVGGARAGLASLVRAGLIEMSWGRDPWGRRVTIIRFRVPLA